MKILDRLPYLDRPSLLSFPTGNIEIRAYQIIVWLRIAKAVFPAIIDTGHSHNLSIPERQLKSWAGVASLKQIGIAEVNRQVLPQFEASVWLHKNRSGTREPTQSSFPLVIQNGITVIPDGT